MDYLDYRRDFLAHHGIKGQKWGVRRFQNEDGSLTEEGKARYFSKDGNMTPEAAKKFRKDWDGNVSSMQQAAKKQDPSRRPESTGKNWDKTYRLMEKEIEKFRSGKKSIFDNAKTNKDFEDIFGDYYVKAALKDFGLNDREVESGLSSLMNLNHSDDLILAHHGIKGQRWGVRRYENEDGTLTDAGKARYSKDKKRYKDPRKMSDAELQAANKRLGAEAQYRQLTGTTQPGKAFNKDTAIKLGSTFVATAAATFLLRKYKTGSWISGDNKKKALGSAAVTAILAGSIGSLIAGAGSLGGSAQPAKEKGD